MLCLWEGFPFPLWGASNILGYQCFAVVALLLTAAYGVLVARRRVPFTRWHLLAALLFASCCFTSLVYSRYIAPQPFMAWGPAVYTVSPILTIFCLTVAGARLQDAEEAIYWTGFAGSLLLLFHNIFQLHFLDFYARGSAFSDGRIVFFKLESTFAMMIALVRAVNRNTLPAMAGECIVAAVTGYNVIVLSESRLAIFAFFLAIILTWTFVFKRERKLVVGVLGPLFALPVFGYVLATYLARFRSVGQYLNSDVSASFRKIEVQHFARFFGETHGLGFGFMSGSDKYDNVISFSTNKAGFLYGTGTYGLGLDDIGLYSALFQFGYLGLALILVMTVIMIFTLARSVRRGDRYAPAAACGMLAAAFMLSPISMNYFTLFYTAHFGGLLWFMAWKARG